LIASFYQSRILRCNEPARLLTRQLVVMQRMPSQALTDKLREVTAGQLKTIRSRRKRRIVKNDPKTDQRTTRRSA
jgi:hypothetical protein